MSVYCICRKPQGRRSMVGCDSCNEWYHKDCVGILENQKLPEKWLCQICVSAGQRLVKTVADMISKSVGNMGRELKTSLSKKIVEEISSAERAGNIKGNKEQNDEIQNRETLISSLQQENDHLNMKIKDLGAQLDFINKEKNQDKEILESALNDKSNIIECLIKEKKELEANLRISESFVKEKKDAMELWFKQRDDLETKLKVYEFSIGERKSEIDMLRLEKAVLNTKLKDFEKSMIDMQKSVQILSEEKDDLGKKLKDSENQLKKVEEEKIKLYRAASYLMKNQREEHASSSAEEASDSLHADCDRPFKKHKRSLSLKKHTGSSNGND